MSTKEISSEEEAQELLAQLERFYQQPVLPLRRFCAAIELWMDCVVKNNTEPALLGNLQPGMLQPYFKHLQQIRIDIRKSNLLGRLLYAKERFRTQMCPIHKGHWNGNAMFFEKCPHLCDGTGWLRQRETDGGYTGDMEIKLVKSPPKPGGGKPQ
jgi:hypothetical protein